MKELFERSLAINVEHEGPDGLNTSISSKNLAQFYLQLASSTRINDERKEHSILSISYCTEYCELKQRYLVRLIIKTKELMLHPICQGTVDIRNVCFRTHIYRNILQNSTLYAIFYAFFMNKYNIKYQITNRFLSS